MGVIDQQCGVDEQGGKCDIRKCYIGGILHISKNQPIILYQILLSNQQPPPTTNMQNILILATAPRALLDNILDYLDEAGLRAVIQALEGAGDGLVPRLCRLRLVFMTVFNRADRSYFFTLYSSNAYRLHENARINCIATTQLASQFCAYPHQLAGILANCQQFVPQSIRQEFAEKVGQFFVDPLLPMPKLMRETQASQVNSTLQTFILQKSDPQDCQLGDIYEQIFENIQQNLEQSEQTYIRSLIKNMPIASEVRNFAHNITHLNYSSKLVGQNQLNNLIVCILGLTDLMLSKIEAYLTVIDDPFELLLELTMRYTQFVNTVMALEENLGYAFNTYGQICDQLSLTANKCSKFSYYKPALNMWIQKMSKFHTTTNKSYVELIYTVYNQTQPTINNQQLLTRINKNNQLHQSTLSHNLSNTVYGLLKEEQSEVKVLLKMYEEYLVDCSVDELSVYYCGYSKQQLGPIYCQAESLFLSKQAEFIELLKQEVYGDEEEVLVCEYLQQRINRFEQILKPRTLKQVANMYISECVLVECEKIPALDQVIERYINRLVACNKIKIVGKLDDNQANTHDKSLTESTDSRSETNNHSFQFYDSESQMEPEEQDVHTMEVETS